MIVSDPQGGKVLVSAQGNINLLVEHERRPGVVWTHVQRNYPAIAAASLAAALVSTMVASYAMYRMHNGFEARVEGRMQQIDARLDTLIANAESRSERQSTSLIQHVDSIGDRVEKVGLQVDQIGQHVDLLPATVEKAAQSSTSSLIGWLANLKPAAPVEPPAPALTVRGPVKRKRQW